MIDELHKKKKIDHEALASSFMRIPKIDVSTARDLIDLGYREYYELLGRSPQSLYDELTKLRAEIPKDKMKKLRIAVYYAKNPGANATILEAVSDEAL